MSIIKKYINNPLHHGDGTGRSFSLGATANDNNLNLEGGIKFKNFSGSAGINTKGKYKANLNYKNLNFNLNPESASIKYTRKF